MHTESGVIDVTRLRVAIALSLGAFVILVFVVTLVRMKANALS